MTEADLDRLAGLIARALIEGAPARGATASAGLVPAPVRPEPPTRGGEPPRSRVTTGELTRLTRAAAAGRGTAPEVAPTGRAVRPPGRAATRELEISVPVGVSNRHVHLSAEDARTLLGRAQPTVRRPLSQPGQYAAEETLTAIGPAGRIEGIRIVGPPRGSTQLEIAKSDARVLGVAPPVAASGALDQSIGGVTLVGTAGSVRLARGVIVAARHLHLSAADAARWALQDGDLLDVRCGEGARATTLHGLLVRAGDRHATELHLDVDEAAATGVGTGDRALVVRAHTAGVPRRALVTERDVQRLAREGGSIAPGALLTPSARDRARALGLLPRD
ncbi:MAG TPA: PduL/EutD family phosphate acyltransferase [Gemmatimonadaceae bacterium]|nr:PduL/EutD family phosphate acyltransferase [Gemmatimonadaceae bacterium]